jgi:hypothetical protein
MESSSLPGDFPPTPPFIPITAAGVSTGRILGCDMEIAHRPKGEKGSWC